MSSDSDDDDFALLVGGGDRISTLEDATIFTHSNSILAHANVLAYKLKKFIERNNKKAKDIKFFKNRQTLQHQGAQMFMKIERWYATHVLKEQWGKKDPGEKSHAQILLLKDPVGVADPPKDDEFCWEKTNVVTSATAASTPRATRATSRLATSTTAGATGTAPAVTATFGTNYK